VKDMLIIAAFCVVAICGYIYISFAVKRKNTVEAAKRLFIERYSRVSFGIRAESHHKASDSIGMRV